jgi:pimeloyl-ACP methyl ester carboxylesterase
MPLLCLAGLTRSERDFDHVAPHLADMRVIRMDYRGRGRSDWADPATYAIPQEAADVVALLDHLGLSRVAVLGTSRGGLVAMWLAARAQAQIASAAAIINADIGAPLGRTLFAYGRSGALFGFRAGIIGTGLAAVCAIAAIMAPRGAPSLGDLWPLLGRTEFLMLCAGPLLAALAAASGARAGGAQAHRKAERVG